MVRKMTTVGEVRSWGVKALSEMGIAEPATSVDMIISVVLCLTRAQVIGYPERHVVPRDLRRILKKIERRMNGEPIQYILGRASFFGLDLSVSPSVLIPRPETEVLVQTVLDLVDRVRRPRMLDVGTGSGCIAIAVGKMRPDAEIIGIDFSPEAIRLAKKNAAELGVSIHFELADLRDERFLHDRMSWFHVVASNPPYLHPSEATSLPMEVSKFEPSIALFTGADPLEYYRLLLSRCCPLMRFGGHLAVEVHEDRSHAVSTVFEEQGLEKVWTRLDLAGRERVVVGQRRGATAADDNDLSDQRPANSSNDWV